jgi:hypothetical protein
MIILGPSLMGPRGTQITGSIIYTLVSNSDWTIVSFDLDMGETDYSSVGRLLVS